MKAIGGLFDQIGNRENLAAAAWRAARGKRHRPAIVAWLEELDEHLATISADLRRGDYRFQNYEGFAIRDPKSRLIHAPAFQDRVVHHAIVAVVGPVLERGAIDHSYACRAGKGQHAALMQVRRWMQLGDWFLKIDVEKFYDSIPHELLMRRLGRRFRERRLLHLWARLLDSYQTRPGHGLPIGALTSQYLGNFYLDSINHLIQEKHPAVKYCRYIDDFLILGPRDSLLSVRDSVAAALDR